MIKNFLSNTINKIRPDQPDEYEFQKMDEGEPLRAVPNLSPRWQKTTKQYIIIAFLILCSISLYFLRNMIGPLIFALILTYLIHPLVSFLHRKTKISWKVCVSFTYILILLGIIVFFAWGGITLFSQAENMINLLIVSIEKFPEMFDAFLAANDHVDPLAIQFNDLFNSSVGTQISQALQGSLKAVGGGLASLAQGAASQLGWMFFVFGISFFILLESRGIEVISIKLPVEGYEFDLLMAKQHLSCIWNSFLRGQVILMVFTIWLYAIVFSVLGLRYSLILALLVGIARLIPYVGSTVAFAAYALVALFQDSSLFGMDRRTYSIMIVVIAFVIDKVMDGFLTPKVMADSLRVHPALVLIFAIVCSRLFGFIGILIAAPIVATLKLLSTYIIRKLRDEDPWAGIDKIPQPPNISDVLDLYYSKAMKQLSVISLQLKKKYEALRRRCRKWKKMKDSGSSGT